MNLDDLLLHSRSGEIKNFVHFLRNFAFNLVEIQYVATTSWFVRAHAKFILHKEYLRERTLLV